jgi:hypothetical protein
MGMVYIMYGGMRNAKILVGKPERKRTLGRYRQRLKNPKEIGWRV